MDFCTDTVHRYSNHPVHLVNNDGSLSPSALIPFCDFGGNMSSMGKKIKEFKVSVCNSFQEKIINDELCYEVDLDKYSNKQNIEDELKYGFALVFSYNEDRQISFGENKVVSTSEESLIKDIVNHDNTLDGKIFVNTIGKHYVSGKHK